MSEYAKIKTCRDITEDHIAAAIESRADTRVLLEHAAKVSAARTGGARVLLLFARMATPACDWLDGALRVEITGDAEGSIVETFAEIGAGLKERIFPPISIDVPVEEFVIAVKKFPKAIAPLAFIRPAPRKIVLTAGEVEKTDTPSSVPPPPQRAMRVKTPNVPLSLGDLPTVGGSGKSIPPPPAAEHLSGEVMSASQIPPPPAAPKIPKFPAKSELRGGTVPKFPPPARKKTEFSTQAFEKLEPKFAPPAIQPPVVEVPQPEPVVKAPKPEPVVDLPVESARKPEELVEQERPVDPPQMEAPKPQVDLPPPEPAQGAASRPLARIQLKRQATPASSPRVVEEIDGRSPAPPKQRVVQPKKPFAVPPPAQSTPPPVVDARETQEKPAPPQPGQGEKSKEVDEGWE